MKDRLKCLSPNHHLRFIRKCKDDPYDVFLQGAVFLEARSALSALEGTFVRVHHHVFIERAFAVPVLPTHLAPVILLSCSKDGRFNLCVAERIEWFETMTFFIVAR